MKFIKREWSKFTEESQAYMLMITGMYVLAFMILWTYRDSMGYWPSIGLIGLYILTYFFVREPEFDKPIWKWFK